MALISTETADRGIGMPAIFVLIGIAFSTAAVAISRNGEKCSIRLCNAQMDKCRSEPIWKNDSAIKEKAAARSIAEEVR